MTTPAFRLQLTDARQLRAALTDARQLRAALTVGALPETTRGAGLSVAGRIPMLSTTGQAPLPASSPWGIGGATVFPVAVDMRAALLGPEPAHYVPGALRPQNGPNRMSIDILRVADSAGAHRDVRVYFGGPIDPQGTQELTVPIGTDGAVALSAGGGVTLTATGGTGPYVWDFAFNRSGGTLTPEGAYVAGPLVGIDRLRVTDSLGEIGLVQAEVIAGQVGADMVVLPEDEPYDFRHSIIGWQCQPYAKVWGVNGVGPYTVALVDNQTGAAIVPPRSMRAVVQLVDLEQNPVDLAGWSFDARLYGQRGGPLASGLVVTVTGNVVEVEIPEPGELLFTPAVLRVEAETAGAILALGYPTVALEALLIAQET